LTNALFLKDSYLKTCESTVVLVKRTKTIQLDQTIFYPKGGGQPGDTGEFIQEKEKYNVIYVEKNLGVIFHEVNQIGLQKGDLIHCVLNWERRYKLMRSHTAAHVFASLLCTGTNALVTGNQITEEKIRFDFNLKEYNPNLIIRYVDEANKLFTKNIPVKWYELSRKDALAIPNIIKMAGAPPPSGPILRVVEIVGVDRQVDGGTHVKNLNEIGQIKVIKTQNKGKNNRRIYFQVI